MVYKLGTDIDLIMSNLEGISFHDQKVLVTGGAGFLGSWICEVLLYQGAEVICLDNLASGLKENISHLIGSDKFQFIKHDISEAISFDENIDIVIHMASRASPLEFEHYPIEILKANTIGLMVSLEIARAHGSRMVYTSTSEIYGNPQEVPTPESCYGYVNSIGPRSCYDEAKRCGEAFVTAYSAQYGLDSRIARLFNTYGPRMRADGIYGRAIPRFIDQALSGTEITVYGDGSQTRSFCYVTDQIEGILRFASMDAARGYVVNIGNDLEISILALAKKVLDITKSDSEIMYQPMPSDDPIRRRPDITRAKELLRWEPKVDLNEGLFKTIEWFKGA
jgi:UDP-glucuronate decarboxylase